MKKSPTKRRLSPTSMISRAREAVSPRRISHAYIGLKRRLKTTAKRIGLRICAPRRILASTTTVAARTSITRKKLGWRSLEVME
jgi:hypothetical protein